jgi:hypothetical protein
MMCFTRESFFELLIFIILLIETLLGLELLSELSRILTWNKRLRSSLVLLNTTYILLLSHCSNLSRIWRNLSLVK